MSSVRKRILPSGEVRWQLDYKDQGGKRRHKQFPTKAAAVAFETTVRAEIAAGTHVADSASITIAEAGELWLQRCRTEGLETGTLKQYGEHLRLHILPFIGSVKLSKLSTPQIEQFKDTLLQSRSRPLTRAILVSLKALLYDARRRGLAVQNPASGVKVTMPKRHEKQIQIPSRDEIKNLIAKTAELWPATLPWRPLVLTALFTGLRASELRGLTWDCVSFDEKFIKVRQRADYKNEMGNPKSAAGTREIPIGAYVSNALRQWRLACPASPQKLVFPTRTGGVISSSIYHKQCWFPLMRALDLGSRYRFHDLRHCAATLFIEQGWTPKRVMSVMGHSSIQMTFDLYGHLWKTSEDDAEAMKQIEARLLG
ncbi:MAG: tyrosine-type recombinase/integrase [Rhodomicrobium sp.]